jgi:hypothetical protein
VSGIAGALTHGRSRALVPGSGRGRLLLAAGAACIVLSAVAIALIATRGSSADRYGTLPSWLPKAKLSTGRTVVASASHPQLAIQGDAVRVLLTGGSVLATTVGPAVPEDGRFPVPPTSPTTFTVTFRSATGAVPLQARAFTILDEESHVHRPTVTLANGRSLPSHVAPGTTLTLRVHDVLPTGGGELRWTPQAGKALVRWDFDVEID